MHLDTLHELARSYSTKITSTIRPYFLYDPSSSGCGLKYPLSTLQFLSLTPAAAA